MFRHNLSCRYSLDNLSSFFFCAYHGGADFTDIGHVLYSVEPFQDVDGCSVRPGTPNGQLIFDQQRPLALTFETITDLDGTAWWNFSGNQSLFGQEIGNECAFLVFVFSGNNLAIYFDPSHVTLN
jgi:hypothetical protein